jgi:hypothetical protein
MNIFYIYLLLIYFAQIIILMYEIQQEDSI